ncbi:hypothetical protein MTR_2g015810 [Medicago truncatula]|uniref:Uncharacterized protein n=1 Tax=Medicago truncatula TaxID=3880 RepID=G7ILI1_MEDTR|nr:hypothetical protein MTR_2g015810 [Medicago truncatula]
MGFSNTPRSHPAFFGLWSVNRTSRPAALYRLGKQNIAKQNKGPTHVWIEKTTDLENLSSLKLFPGNYYSIKPTN